MAEESSAVNDPPSPPPFLEVICKNSGKKNRFAAGTPAGFAVSVINRKLDSGNPNAIYIQSLKEGEEPISFGPDAVLVDYGNGWKLQTVTELDYSGTAKEEGVHELLPAQVPAASVPVSSADADHKMRTKTKKPEPETKPKPEPNSEIGLGYIGKIVLAFVLMFLFGAVFTMALENLPRLILYINSSM